MLAREHWIRVPELTAGERSGLFAMEDALYGCYLRVGDPGPWAGPCASDARLEVPSRHRPRRGDPEAANQAAGWLPGFASALHRDARALVNLDLPSDASAPGPPTGCCRKHPAAAHTVPDDVPPRSFRLNDDSPNASETFAGAIALALLVGGARRRTAS